MTTNISFCFMNMFILICYIYIQRNNDTNHGLHVIMKNNINYLKYVTDFSDTGNNL